MRKIRILKGRKVSTKAEILEYAKNVSSKRAVLIGSASNYEAVRNDMVLYSKEDLFGNVRLYLTFEEMASLNIALASMGRGKTTLMENVIASAPDNQMVIFDPKCEYNVSFFDEQRDMLLTYPDKLGAVWHIFEEVLRDRQIESLIWLNMLRVIRNGDNASSQWDSYALPWLSRLAREVMAQKRDLQDIPALIALKYQEYKKEAQNNKTGMQDDALGTAAPVFNALFQMYYVAVKDNRKLVTLDEMMKARRLFICSPMQFEAQLKIINNALLACLFSRYLSRRNVPREKVADYVFFMIDEYLTSLDIDPTTEKNAFTLCRSKGIVCFLGMQYLPVDPAKLELITSSRFATFVFRSDSANARAKIEDLFDDVEYQRTEETESISDSGGLTFSGSSLSNNDVFVDVKTKQVTQQMIARMSPYVALIEINGLSCGQVTTFVRVPLIEKLKNPCRIDATSGEEGFLYSDAARTCPRIEEFYFE